MSDTAQDGLFVIASLPRCGSTTLARMLNGHPEIRCLVEPFHPKRYDGRFHELVWGPGGVEAAFQVIRRRWNGIKHVWESSGWPFVGRPKIHEGILAGPGRKVILLVRRNGLRRAVSNLLCRQTRYWMGSRDEFVSRMQAAELRPLHANRVRQLMQQDREAIARTVELLSRRQVPFRTFYYEDLFREASDADRLDLTNALLAFLGRAPITRRTFLERWQQHFDPEQYQWASADIYRRIPDIERLEQQVGSDETGWLFRGF